MSGTRIVNREHQTIGVPRAPLTIGNVNNSWALGFTDVGALTTDINNLTPSSPMTVSQSGGNLVIATGIAANAEFLARYDLPFMAPFIFRARSTLSQRIANQNFAVIMADMIGDNLATTINSSTQITVRKVAHGFTARNVGQNMFVGGITGAAGVPGRYAIASVPDENNIVFTVSGWPASGSCTVDLFGWNYHRILYTGATATNMAVDSQRNGWASGDTTATINTTASPGHIAQMRVQPRNVLFEDALAASTTIPAFSTRASRYENIPNEETPLYIYVWAFNGSTAPASTTNWTIGFLSVEDFSDTRVAISGIDQIGQAAPLPVAVAANSVTLGTSTASIGATQINPNSTFGNLTTSSTILGATTNAANIKSSAANVGALIAHNDSATKFYVKIYNKASAPVIGTDVPVLRIPVPANSQVDLPVGAAGLRLSAGLAIAVTRGLADADATATAASDGVINVIYN